MTTEEFEKLTFRVLVDYASAVDANERSNVKYVDNPSFEDERHIESIDDAIMGIVDWECHFCGSIYVFPQECVGYLLDRLSNNDGFPFKDKLDEYKEFLEHSKDEAYWEEHKEPREPINLDAYDVDHLPF